ncbi:MAG: NADH-quinone oxidoreductase subunit NuoN [Rhizobiales bacterium]|nr:NADH-quinone oxidoreductase subunit NuoN [Hyphomicrobiales bacterium]MBI3672555.1 NADH-quinone oxidoreductase subunit NuoN [Hyphomicrobiales bacterium]
MQFLQHAQAMVALPEMVLAGLAMALLMFGVFRRDDANDAVTIGALVALAAAAVLVMTGSDGKGFGEAFINDSFARVMKLFTLFGSAVAVVLSVHFLKREKSARFEYPVLVLLATTGMMMMISANSLIALYMGLELQSLALYVVAAFNRDSARSSEAGLKYFVLGALSSGMLLYGASLIYGFTGTVSFTGIAQAIATNGAGIGVIFGIVFVIAGLAFKVSAVPFHMWTPDVYEGAPTPITAFFASAPKLAAMALFTRVMMQPFAAATAEWQQVLVFISIASMALGAFAAIGQTNIKRLLAYSSIGHMGYVLLGLAAGTLEGVRGVAIYMMIYLITTLGSFACVIAMRRQGRQVEEIADLAGLARTDRGLAFVLAMLMFSLAGIPPLAGFFAKLFIFLAAVKTGLFILAIIGVVTSVVGAYYYLRIVKLMYFDEPAEAFDPMDGEVKLVAYAAGAFTLLFVLIANPLLNLALTAAQAFAAP